MSYIPIFCQVKDLMKIRNLGKFHQYSICGCQVKIFKLCLLIPYWEVSGPLLPKVLSNFAEILTRVSTLADKNIVWRFFEGFELLWKRTDPQCALLVQHWSPVFPWRWPKSKKIITSSKKLQPLGYPNMSKPRLYLLSPFREKYDYFCTI